MDQIIIHVDMDAFFASVEIRDDPSLKGKPVIIGSLPHERGVVSTCSYEAREFGVHSAMNIKEAYRLCPQGVYMHPNFNKYKAVSDQLHDIWAQYATVAEYIALDEAYLDVTETAGSFERAVEFAMEIKQRTKDEVGLTCSVGVAYSMAAAKVASEEMKPNGFYQIRTPQEYVDLVVDRDVRILFSVGVKTAERLNSIGIETVRDLLDRQEDVIDLFGNSGEFLVRIASGMDDRKVTAYNPDEAKSISREVTFQEDVIDRVLLEDVLLLLSICVDSRARYHKLHGRGVAIKVTFSNMKGITRSKVTYSCDSPLAIYREGVEMLSALKRRPVRLIGIGIYNLSSKGVRQTTLDSILGIEKGAQEKELKDALGVLRKRYRYDFASNMSKLCNNESLHKVIEEMRIQRLR